MKIVIEPGEVESDIRETFENLEDFRDWFFAASEAGEFTQIPLKDFSFLMDGLTAFTLYRRGDYQAEILVGRPGYWYVGTVVPGQTWYVTYRGGHVLMKLDDGGIRDWNPELYLQDSSVRNAREESSSWCGEGGLYEEGREFHFSLARVGGYSGLLPQGCAVQILLGTGEDC